MIFVFLVSGCADEVDTPTVWYERTSALTAKMGCRYEAMQWNMHCDGVTWVGTRGNCSASEFKVHTIINAILMFMEEARYFEFFVFFFLSLSS